MILELIRRRRAAILLLVAGLAAAGVARVARMPVSIFPSVTFPLVKIIADVGEEPAAQMMPAVTRPLEEALLRIPGIEMVRSTTSRGSVELSGHFAWGTDMQVALQRAQAETERVRAQLPSQTKIEVQWMNPAVFPIQGYALTSQTRSQGDLRALADYTLKPALVRIPGVAQVQIQGGRLREFQVVLDPRALEARHLSTADVVAAIQKQDALLSAGLIERNHELYLTVVDGRVQDLASLARITVAVPGGLPAALGDLGKVQVGDEVSYIRTTADGRPAVLVNIVRQPAANTLSIAQEVDALFRREPGLLPPGVQWINFYDQARFVSDSVAGVRDAILIGVVLAGLVLLLFLRNVRMALVAVGIIPVCAAIVGLLLGLLGETVNLMSLAGMAAALGLIADDAIVVVENIHRHDEEGGSEDPVRSGLEEILPALLGSSLSTIVIFLPFAGLTGVVGAFFKPLALTLAVALIVSFFLAVTVVPMGIRLGSRPAAPARTSAFGAALMARYLRLVRAMLRGGIPSMASCVVCLAGAALLYRSIGTDFLPGMDEGSVVLDYWTPPGTSLTDTDAMLTAAEKEIQAVPDIAGYSRRTGTQLGFFVTEPNRGDYVLKLKPRGQRRAVDEVINDLRSRIAAVEPSIHTDFGQLLEDAIGDLTGGAPQPVDVRIFGEDPAVLQATARSVAAAIGTIEGVEDVFDGIVIAGPALDVRVDPEAAARYGLSTDSIHAVLEPSIEGTVTGKVRVGERLHDLRVLAPSTAQLGDLRIRTPSGALVPVSAVARVATGQPEAEIARENLRSFVGVTARLTGRDLGTAMAEIRARVEPIVARASGLSVSYGGLFEQQQQSFASLFWVLLGGLGLVSLVLLFEFADWRAPLVTALTALAVLAGVLLALKLSGMTLNVSSYVGAIMVVGLVGENAIFVIHEARLELGRGTPVAQAWERASLTRLRPVAMTVLATTLALGPLAIALGAGAQLMQPLAIAIIGGFGLSAPGVLLVVPGLYRWMDPAGRLGGRLG